MMNAIERACEEIKAESERLYTHKRTLDLADVREILRKHFAPTCEVCGGKGYVHDDAGRGYPCPADCKHFAEPAERAAACWRIVQDAINNSHDEGDYSWEEQAKLAADWIRRRHKLSEPAERADQWRSIESAPKDGTRILAFTGNGQHPIVITRWANSYGLVGVDADAWCWSYPGFMTTVTPTHWQPLPLPPQEQANG